MIKDQSSCVGHRQPSGSFTSLWMAHLLVLLLRIVHARTAVLLRTILEKHYITTGSILWMCEEDLPRCLLTIKEV